MGLLLDRIGRGAEAGPASTARAVVGAEGNHLANLAPPGFEIVSAARGAVVGDVQGDTAAWAGNVHGIAPRVDEHGVSLRVVVEAPDWTSPYVRRKHSFIPFLLPRSFSNPYVMNRTEDVTWCRWVV
jgi:hypothetical protein